MSDTNENPAEAATETEESAAPAKKAAAKKAAAKKTTKKTTAKKATTKKAAAKKTSKKAAEEPASDDAAISAADTAETEPAKPKKKAAAPRKRAAKPAAETPGETGAEAGAEGGADEGPTAPMVLFQPPTKPAPRKRATKKAAAEPPAEEGPAGEAEEAPAKKAAAKKTAAKKTAAKKTAAKKTAAKKGGTQDETEPVDTAEPAEPTAPPESAEQPEGAQDAADSNESGDTDEEGRPARRRRRRGGRRRRKSGGGGSDNSGAESEQDEQAAEESAAGSDESGGEGSGSRRRRTRNRTPKSPEDEIASVSGSTRLEAKKQRRREGREAGRRRAPILSESEFLARREAVDRVMVIRQRDDLTQIGVLEDKVLVEHYVSRASQTSLIGNVYLGRVQNVLPSMEAAFIDIGKGRNAVLYAGEVNWSGLGHKDGKPRRIETVLQPGQTVLVQVTKDPIGHKGARLTGQVSLPGRFLVFVPEGTTSGISRKLPDTERSRLKSLLKEIVPEGSGVIVRTAAEGATEEELTRDVERLTSRWGEIQKKIESGKAPELLYGEPALTLKVVRDLFTEDFSKLIVEGDAAWEMVEGYVSDFAPDLSERLEHFETGNGGKDLFATYRVDEQIAKGLERKVWLPSGGSLVIDRTEAMTVVDVNTGKFTGSGGNLEETVTRNNLEAAEEIVRQLRLRDIGGIIVVDFIDMVLESNRDLVLRRLVECLGRDRTRHQVAEVTSLGLVQMTRKRIGTGLLEAFSEECSACKGRGVLVHDHPIDTAGSSASDSGDSRGRRRGGRGRNRSETPPPPSSPPSPKDIAAMRPTPPEEEPAEDTGNAEDETPAVAEPTVDAEETEPAVTVEESAVQETEEPAAATVTVVTSTRRRTARRPAGPPKSVSEPVTPVETPVESAEQPGGERSNESSTQEPPAEPSDDAQPVVVPATDEGTESAAPSASENGDETAAQSGDVAEAHVSGPSADGAEAAEEDAGAAGETDDAEPEPVPHVPVKKKGTRKR